LIERIVLLRCREQCLLVSFRRLLNRTTPIFWLTPLREYTSWTIAFVEENNGSFSFQYELESEYSNVVRFVSAVQNYGSGEQFACPYTSSSGSLSITWWITSRTPLICTVLVLTTNLSPTWKKIERTLIGDIDNVYMGMRVSDTPSKAQKNLRFSSERAMALPVAVTLVTYLA
jgi:hypothetical protein